MQHTADSSRIISGSAQGLIGNYRADFGEEELGGLPTGVIITVGLLGKNVPPFCDNGSENDAGAADSYDRGGGGVSRALAIF